MLGKLFKYEWRSISKLLLPIHGFVLLFALLSRFYFTISGGTDALLNTDSRPGLPYKYPACNTITALTFKRTCCFTMASY